MRKEAFLELDGVNEGMLTVETPDLDNEVRIYITGFQHEEVYLTLDQIAELRDFLSALLQSTTQEKGGDFCKCGKHNISKDDPMMEGVIICADCDKEIQKQ